MEKQPAWSRSVQRYGAAIALCGVALMLRLLLAPLIGERAPFATFYFAVVLAACFLGTGPAVLVTLVGGVLANYIFLEPFGSLVIDEHTDLFLLSFYLVVSATIIVALDAQRRAKALAERQSALARERLEQLKVEMDARERAQQAEADQRQWYETTLRSIGDAVIATDHQGRVKFLNSVAENLVGWKAAEVAGRPIHDVFVVRNEETGQPEEIPVDRVLREGHAVALANHTLLVSRDGLMVPIDDSAAPIRGHDGELRGVVLVFRDVREQRASEQAMRQSLSDMEKFAYIASHDLQEPLRTVSVFTELLDRHVRGQSDKSVQEYLHFIATGASRMRQLVADLLEYSRAGASAVSVNRVATEEILRDVAESLRASIEATGATLSHDPLPVIFADRQKLSQVFQNLIGNAIKFRRDVPCEVHVSAEPKDGMWVFSVRDNGIGFPPEYSERIFGMFQRLKSGDHLSGSGIGLAISKRIIEGHQGRIWAESKPGEGSTFRFAIPRTPARIADRRAPKDVPPDLSRR